MLMERLQVIQAKNPFQNLSESVYDLLCQSIIDLSLAPGSSLSETALSEELGLSRTPVRNALMKLQSVGLIMQTKGQAFQIAPIQRDDCQSLMEVRTIIEGQAAYWAAERITEQEGKRLKESLKAYVQSYRDWNINSMVESDHHFHKLVIDAAHNDLLRDMYDMISPRVLHYRYFLFHKTDEKLLRPIMGGSVRHHQALWNAIEMGFSGAAKECMEKDIAGMVDIMGYW